MPKTFQDAVSITRSLGFEYLWIDSLCIIQGKEGDWEEQAQKMGQIYRDSVLTIVAAAAKNAGTGCF